jgi:anti-sigma regulatory factor (Ser/Thr protein kinase)
MKTLKVKAEVSNLAQVLEFVDGVLEELECPMRKQMQIDVAVEELFVNVASYAYQPLQGDVEICIWVEDNPRSVAIRFTDSGIYYDPLAKEDPDINRPVEERQIGGLGIFMVKKSMDDMQYARENGNNVVTIRKFLQ